MHGHSRWPLWLLAAACAALLAWRARHQLQQQRLQGSLIAQPATTAEAASAAADAPPWPLGSGADDGAHAGRALHGGPLRRHRAPAFGPRAPRIAWQRELGAAIEAQPVLSPDGARLHVVTLGGEVITLDAARGDELWRHSEGKRLYATPYVRDDGSLVIGADGGAVVALSAAGKVLFRHEVEGDCDVALSATARGELLAACGRAVLKLSPRGQLLARAELPKKAFSSLAHDEHTLYLGAQDDQVYAFSLQNLSVRWQRALGADVDGGVALGDDGAVFVGTDGGEVVALAAADGHVRWRRKLGFAVRGPLSVARNGDVLAGVFGKQPALVRLDAQGTERFRFLLMGNGAEEFGVRGGALEDARGALYFGAQDDALYALSPSGALRFRLALDGDVDAPLLLHPNGALYVATYAGKIVCLTPESE